MLNDQSITSPHNEPQRFPDFFRSSHWRCSMKNIVLKNFANFTGKHLCWSLFLIMLQVFRPVTIQKRDSNTDAFLRNLQIFLEHLFWRTSTKDCFYLSAKYFFECNGFIQSNVAISFIYKLKNVSLTFQLTFSLNFSLYFMRFDSLFEFPFTPGKLGRYDVI